MIICIIIHNIIVEDGCHTYIHYYDSSEFLNDKPINRHRRTFTEDDKQIFQYSTQQIGNISSYMTNMTHLRNRESNNNLKNDLIEHL